MTRGDSEKTTPWPAGRIKRCCVCLSLGLVAPLCLLTTGCDLPGRPDPAERPVPTDRVLKFGVLYRQNCAGCHGVDGKLGPAPPLNDPLFRAIVPEEDLKDILTKGRKETLMPAFANENGGVLSACKSRCWRTRSKVSPTEIVERAKLASPRSKSCLMPTGFPQRGGCPENCQRVCRPTSNQQAPVAAAPATRKRSRGFRPGLRGLSWEPRARHRTGDTERSAPEPTGVPGPHQ